MHLQLTERPDDGSDNVVKLYDKYRNRPFFTEAMAQFITKFLSLDEVKKIVLTSKTYYVRVILKTCVIKELLAICKLKCALLDYDNRVLGYEIRLYTLDCKKDITIFCNVPELYEEEAVNILASLRN
jgi:hypothetical protein